MLSLYNIVFIIGGLAVLYLFYSVIYGKIKLYRARLKMQEQGQISQSENLTANTFCNIIFWFYPITKYRDKGSVEHNKLASKVNYSLLGLLVAFLIVSLSNIVLN